MEKFLKGIAWTVSVLVGAFLIFLLVLTITDYRPDDKIPISIENRQDKKIAQKEPLSIVTYNIGYGGMDKDQDFFMDGGHSSQSSSKEKTMENLNGIMERKNGLIGFKRYLKILNQKALLGQQIKVFLLQEQMLLPIQEM
jgi:hypothetical protein